MMPLDTRKKFLNIVLPCLLLSVLAAATALGMGGSPSSFESLGLAQKFNVFVLKDFSAQNSATEGRLAAGGDIELNQYSVGRSLSRDFSEASLVSGGDIHFPSGRVDRGNILAKGSADGVGLNVINGLRPPQELLDGQELEFDFIQEFQSLARLSEQLATLVSNGQSQFMWSSLSLEGDCQSDLQVFTIDGEELSDAHSLHLSCVPDGATLVLNVSGQEVSMGNMGMGQLNAFSDRLLFNFHQADYLTLRSISIQGSILAPTADVSANNGVLNGSIIAQSWDGSMTLRHNPFVGDLPKLEVVEGAPNSPVWLASENRIISYVPGKGITENIVDFGHGVEQLLVDAHRNRLVVKAADELHIWSLDHDLTPGEKSSLLLDGALNSPVRLNAISGEMAYTNGDSLHVVDPDQGSAYSVTIAGLSAFAAGDRSTPFYTASGNDVQGRNPEGEVSSILTLDHKVTDLVYDAQVGRLWALGDGVISAHDGETEVVMLEVSSGQVGSMLPNGQGQLWVTGDAGVFLLNDGGILELISASLNSAGQSVADSATGGLWHLQAEQLHYFDASGDLEGSFSIAAEVGQASFDQIDLYSDVYPPEITVEEPEQGARLDQSNVHLRINVRDLGLGLEEETITLLLDQEPLNEYCQFESQPQQGGVDIACFASSLEDGSHTLVIIANDIGGNIASKSHDFNIDTTEPLALTLTRPQDGFHTNEASISINGKLNKAGSVQINNNSIPLSDDYEFEAQVTLEEGENMISIVAISTSGESVEQSPLVVLDTVAPEAPNANLVNVSLSEDGNASVTGAAGSVEANGSVTIINTRTGETQTTSADEYGAFNLNIKAEADDQFELTSSDKAGNNSSTSQLTFSGLPPDPKTVAPPLSQTGVTPFLESNAFLYSGSNPIQTGVSPEAIDARRVAVVRGRVLNRQGEPLSGVTLTVKDHPDLGKTASREDGRFDLAVNGGGYLTFNYEKEDFLPVQRRVNAPWRDYVFLDDVVMIPLDQKVTSIDLSAQQMQVAQGSEQSDSDGSRQFTMLFPIGTTATMTLPDGSVQELTNLDVRATEYTLGENGPETMPGELPATSGYTYAVELSVDQALRAGAERVDFSQPIPTYVDNFLNFPTGQIVPLGYYDRNKAAWIGSDNGRVVEILAIEDERAVLDVNGEGLAATEQELERLNISQSELQQLAQLYKAGQSFWRAPIPHFTPWDHNWPYGPPDDAEKPEVSDPETTDQNEPEDSKEGCEHKGCVISGQAQTLGERIDLVGTPLDLVYQSKRTAGFKGNRTEITVTDNDVSASLKKVRLTVRIAGQQVIRTFSGAPNQSFMFEWDGEDGFGRTMVGEQIARIQLSYIYPCVYYAASENFDRAWAAVGNPDEVIATRDENCDGFRYHQKFSVTLTSPTKHQPNSANGWSLDNHHAYHSGTNNLYLGSGEQRPVIGAPTIKYVAGTTLSELGYPQSGFGGDGGPATEALLDDPSHMAFDSVGNLYIADRVNNRIRKVDVHGIITTFAGTGENGFSGDDGPAVEANLSYPRGIAIGPRDEVYIMDDGNSRIRKVDSNGIITTVVGNGDQCPRYSTGDWSGLATNAPVCHMRGAAFDREGNLYFAHLGYSNKSRVYKVDTSGVITVFAGTGRSYSRGDGGPATQADLEFPQDVAIDSVGNVYILTSKRVRMVSPDGIIWTVAGNGTWESAGDGELAIHSGLALPVAIVLDADDNLYIAAQRDNIVRKVLPNGTITTAAGIGPGEWMHFSVDGMPVSKGNIPAPAGLAVNAVGEVYVSSDLGQVFRISKFKTGESGVLLDIPSRDGTKLYGFNELGRHEVTLDATSKNVLFEFGYSQEGHLTKVTDGDNNVISIERNSSGFATAIVAPDGQRTELSTNESGMLNEVLDPAGHRWAMQYTNDGLLTSFEDSNGNVDRFEYSADGRLVHNSQANGGQWNLERTSGENGYRTEMTSGENLVYGYEVQQNFLGHRTYIDTAPDGTVTERSYTGDHTHIVHPDGMQSIRQEGPDPRFGMAAPVTTSHRLITPGGITHERTGERTAALADSQDLLSHTALTETTNINGRAFTSVYDTGSRTWIMTSPEGRVLQQINNTNGRPDQIKPAGLAVTQLEYDQRGRLTGLFTGEGDQQRSSSWSYDSMGNLASVTDELNRTTSFKYDSAERVTEQSLPDGRAIKYQYDANGNLTAITPPGREAHLFNYNSVDHSADYTPPELGEVTTITQYQYNLDRRLTQVDRPDGRSIKLEYNTGGKLATTTIERGSYSYNYDQTTGQLATIIAPDGGQLSYSYDGALPLSETWSGDVAGSVSRTYDNNFWVRERCVNDSECISFDYDQDGLLIQAGSLILTRHPDHGLRTKSALGNVSSEWQYTPFGEVDSFLTSFSDGSLASIGYQRDRLGRITSKVTQIQGQATEDSYSYDDAGRVIAATRNGATTTWSYDTNGNRTHENGVQIAIYDAQDRLLSYRSASYEYTKNGELKGKTEGGTATSYSYDELSNLTAVSLPGDVNIEYVIDGQNRRIGKKVNGDLVQGFLYADQLNPIAELDANGAVEARFVYGTKINVPDYMIKGGAVYRIVSDHLGSPRLVINSVTGELAQEITYDVWGNILYDSNPGFQPFGFAGGIYDQHTELVRFGARDYDPETGRWTARDPIGFAGGDTNLYGYVLGDPANFIDAFGLSRGVGTSSGGLTGPTNSNPISGPTYAKRGFVERQVNRGIGVGLGKASGGSFTVDPKTGKIIPKTSPKAGVFGRIFWPLSLWAGGTPLSCSALDCNGDGLIDHTGEPLYPEEGGYCPAY